MEFELGEQVTQPIVYVTDMLLPDGEDGRILRKYTGYVMNIDTFVMWGIYSYSISKNYHEHDELAYV